MRRLFVPHVHPIDPAALDSVGNAVQRVTDDPVTGLRPSACSVSTNRSATRLLIAEFPWGSLLAEVCRQRTARHIPRSGEHAALFGELSAIAMRQHNARPPPDRGIPISGANRRNSGHIKLRQHAIPSPTHRTCRSSPDSALVASCFICSRCLESSGRPRGQSGSAETGCSSWDALQLQRDATEAKRGGNAAGAKYIQAPSLSVDGTRLTKYPFCILERRRSCHGDHHSDCRSAIDLFCR